MRKHSPWRLINVLRIIYAVKRKQRVWIWVHENGDIEVL